MHEQPRAEYERHPGEAAYVEDIVWSPVQPVEVGV
jgi:lipopolysaccharide transport system ATP-binding protein